MWKAITYKVIFFGLNIVLICKEVHNFSECPAINLKNGKYNAKKQIYECDDESYYLFGNKTLTCKEDGSWKGEVPYCASPISDIEIWKDNSEKTKFLRTNECGDVPGSNEPWEINLSPKSFSAIKIVFKGTRTLCPKVKLSVVDNGKVVINKEYAVSCNRNQIQFKHEFPNIKGTIKFHLSQSAWHEFSVCKIYVYSKSDENCPISRKQQSNGYILPKNINTLEYGQNVLFNCNEGFQLNGNPRFYCGVNNISELSIISKCPRIQCKGIPSEILNSLWENWNTSTNYFVGDELHFNCQPGYKLNATGHIKCLKNGKWSHTHASCLENKFPIYLIITIVIVAAMILLILLFVGLFLVQRKRKKRNPLDEETKQEHIYSEINYEDVRKEEPPPLPKQMTNRKINQMQSSTDNDVENQVHYGSIDSKQNVDTNINTTDVTLRKNDNEISVNNQLYSSD